MYDIENIIQNIERIYDSTSSFQVLKDFERVIDEFNIYVYENWEDGELVDGPKIERHWVTCTFMWPRDRMPDPAGAKRLINYNCDVKYIKSTISQPRKIRTPDDIRPNTRKGKIDTKPVWFVQITIPKELIANIWQGYNQRKTKEYTAMKVKDDQVDLIKNQRSDVEADASPNAGQPQMPGGMTPPPSPI